MRGVDWTQSELSLSGPLASLHSDNGGCASNKSPDWWVHPSHHQHPHHTLTPPSLPRLLLLIHITALALPVYTSRFLPYLSHG